MYSTQVLYPEQTIIHKWMKEAVTILGSALLIALFAPVSIRLPFTPIPIAMQLHVILFLALILKSRRAAASVATFLLFGALGMPVFGAGLQGVARFVGPTGGYLAGYLLAAYVTGYLCEKAKEETIGRALCAVVVGNLLVYLMGSFWLGTFVGGWQKALLLGVLPFLPGDALKTVVILKAWKKSGIRLIQN